MSILVIAEHNNQHLQAATLNTISAASQLQQTIDVMVVGAGIQPVLDSLSNIEGVQSILAVDDSALEHASAEQITTQIMAVADKYDYFFSSATTFGKNLMPRLAALLNVAQLSDIVAIVDTDTFKRPIYAGNAIATVKSLDHKKVITVRGTAFDEAVSGSNSAAIENLSAIDTNVSSEYVSEELTVSERPELTSAKVIISGGRGMQNGDNFHMLDEIADKLGAAVGASRAAVDAGFVPNDYQVGQTGKIVAPDLYIAVGISGAIQHLAGMKDSKVIVAINKDEEAPIFQVADYGLVMDLFDALPQLSQALD